jgi:starvation-inducible DNA-binding protein
MYETNNISLAEKLSHLLGDVVTMNHITQGYHWNVKGINFSQFHDFFSEIYEDVDGSIDPLAENIRKIGYDSPYLLQDFLELGCIDERRVTGTAEEMLTSLARINATVIDCLNGAFHVADECDEQGIADFLAGRIDMHKKWQWQIESTLGIR